jgi:hypothetical protein
VDGFPLAAGAERVFDFVVAAGLDRDFVVAAFFAAETPVTAFLVTPFFVVAFLAEEAGFFAVAVFLAVKVDLPDDAAFFADTYFLAGAAFAAVARLPFCAVVEDDDFGFVAVREAGFFDGLVVDPFADAGFLGAGVFSLAASGRTLGASLSPMDPSVGRTCPSLLHARWLC